MTKPHKISLSFNEKTSEIIEDISKNLRTTPDQVVSQAIALLMKAQGKKIILRDEKTNVDLVTDIYSDKPAQKG